MCFVVRQFSCQNLAGKLALFVEIYSRQREIIVIWRVLWQEELQKLEVPAKKSSFRIKRQKKRSLPAAFQAHRLAPSSIFASTYDTVL